jgi:hypothetical protein
VFQWWHGNDHDGNTHFRHRPNVHAIPVRAGLNSDEADQADDDGYYAERKGNDETVSLSASKFKDSK